VPALTKSAPSLSIARMARPVGAAPAATVPDGADVVEDGEERPCADVSARPGRFAASRRRAIRSSAAIEAEKTGSLNF